MKHITKRAAVAATLGLALSYSAHAFERPAAMVCNRPSRNPASSAPVEIKFDRFNTAKPNSNLADASLLDPLKADFTYTTFTFTNECDNNYEFLFFTQDLVRLTQGRVSRVTGLLQASVADENLGQFETVALSCEIR
jgi:hypothetical protein